VVDGWIVVNFTGFKSGLRIYFIGMPCDVFLLYDIILYYLNKLKI
jgi:hypothetical protein